MPVCPWSLCSTAWYPCCKIDWWIDTVEWTNQQWTLFFSEFVSVCSAARMTANVAHGSDDSWTIYKNNARAPESSAICAAKYISVHKYLNTQILVLAASHLLRPGSTVALLNEKSWHVNELQSFAAESTSPYSQSYLFQNDLAAGYADTGYPNGLLVHDYLEF